MGPPRFNHQGVNFVYWDIPLSTSIVFPLAMEVKASGEQVPERGRSPSKDAGVKLDS